MAESVRFIEGGRPSEQEVLNLVRSRGDHAIDHFGRYFGKIRRWYDFYRGIAKTSFPAYRNDIHIPILFSYVWSDVANKVQATFGSWPIVSFSGYGPDDEPNAKKAEILISAQMKDVRSVEKAVQFFAQADIYGTAIARDYWYNITEHRTLRKGVPGGGEQIYRGPITTFDGPNWEVVDILDFWPQPGKRDLDDCSWVIHRFYADYDDILEYNEGSAYPIYDKAAVQRLRAVPMPQSMVDDMKERANIYRFFGEWHARNREPFRRPVEIWEYWGRVPSEFAIEGNRNVVITIANGNVVLRYQQNPFFHGKIPFHVYRPMPDPHDFHGTGKIEIGEKMQAASNKLVNQKLDALDLFINPTFIASRQAGLDFEALHTIPARIFTAEGPVGDDIIRPLSPDLRGLQLAFTELEQLSRFMQQGTGMIEDVVQGQSSGERVTAREFVGRREQVMTRLMLEAKLAGECFVEPLANRFHALNNQFLTLPKQIKILGSAAITNPVTGLPYPQVPTDITVEDLNPEYRARASGVDMLFSKAARRDALLMGGQFAAAHPIGLQITNWVSFFNEFWKALSLDPKTMTVTQIPAIQQFAQDTEQSPEDVLNQAEGRGAPMEPFNQEAI